MKKFFILFLMVICGIAIMKYNVKASSISYIYVDLKGAVETPGVYRVSDDTRLFQLVELAGGLKEESYTKNINLSSHLEDELVIYIPFIGENEGSTSGLININTASASTLDELPGVGPTIANNIVVYREENGNFQSIEDIQKVNGVGNAVYSQIKNLITI